MKIDPIAFAIAVNRAVAIEAQSSGIGTLGEKMLHRTLKYYLEPDENNHEIPYLGSIADIKNEEGIIEIQTRSFNKLIPKLERFLPEKRVTIVYPIIQNKTICRIDTETGESLSPKKSSKKGKPSDALGELSMIRRFIPYDNLTILIALLDATETRMLNGKICVGRKKTSKINCVPTSINSFIQLNEPDDYRLLLPSILPDSFTAQEFERYSGLRTVNSHGALMLLMELGILSRVRKGREAYVYSVN